MKVPFLDLRAVNAAYAEQLADAFDRVLGSGWFVQGAELEAFEAEFAAYCNVRHCVGVGSGLDAIQLLLVASGVGAGDEVIVPSNTFVATWLAVTRCGAVPVAAEPDPLTYNIDPRAIEAAITPRTVAIIPVHLYGQPADMEAINVIAKRYGLFVIEDAAQSQGARYRGRRAGSLGHAAATSFYPGKNLGALGDGGAVLCSDTAIADQVRRLRNYGSTVKYQHELLGYNSRLDEIQAAFLRAKLVDLDRSNARRSAIASLYTSRMDGEELVLPFVPEWAEPVWHLYVVRTKQRDALKDHLRRSGIDTLVHYPVPPHMQQCYGDLPQKLLPIAESLAGEVLSLPISPVMRNEEVEYIVEQVLKFH